MDYLLKPFGPKRLAAAMERVRSALGEPVSVDAIERLSAALAGGPISRLFVRIGWTLVRLPVERVSRFEADGDYVIAHSENGRHVLHLSLSRLEARLDMRRFVRVHRTHIVNLEQARAFSLMRAAISRPSWSTGRACRSAVRGRASSGAWGGSTRSARGTLVPRIISLYPLDHLKIATKAPSMNTDGRFASDTQFPVSERGKRWIRSSNWRPTSGPQT